MKRDPLRSKVSTKVQRTLVNGRQRPSCSTDSVAVVRARSRAADVATNSACACLGLAGPSAWTTRIRASRIASAPSVGSRVDRWA
jgi:hypothetical protein